jgi:hypothetical protein
MIATTTSNPPAPQMVQANSGRRAHRIICVFAGGLAVLGGILGLLVNPWFAVIAAVGGSCLILAPETSRS